MSGAALRLDTFGMGADGGTRLIIRKALTNGWGIAYAIRVPTIALEAAAKGAPP